MLAEELPRGMMHSPYREFNRRESLKLPPLKFVEVRAVDPVWLQPFDHVMMTRDRYERLFPAPYSLRYRCASDLRHGTIHNAGEFIHHGQLGAFCKRAG